VLEEWVDVGILTQKLEYKQYLYELLSGKVKQVFPKLLTEYEEAALKYYTTNAGYKHFNKALRGEIAMTEEFAAQERILNKALDKLPISEYNSADKLLYRIENLTDVQISEYYQVGKTITNKHFTSATYDLDAIARVMREREYTVLIHIYGKNGRLIEEISTLMSEKEILFKSQTKFFVQKISKTTNPDTLDPILTIKLIER
jgi:NADH dehydrogenase/NADH:ubiquinone oxidoreductase subunit G